MNRATLIGLFVATLCAIGAAYLPGLSGGFLLDDHANLGVLKSWVEGTMLWQQVVLHNSSGPLGRPISMATFLGNAAAFGMSPWAFKATNLLIHFACAGLVAGFLNALFRNDSHLRRHALIAALAIAVWWALLPIHVSTVLYIIQRMAQLSVLFLFAGLWLYTAARNRIEEGDNGGVWMLWLGVPLLTALGTLSKENGLLLPLLCLAVEIGYFAHRGLPRNVKWFFAIFLLIPGLAATLWLAANPERLLAGYVSRDFTLFERVLTQPRILWDYVTQILVPFGPKLGLFHDSYPHSTGLFSPVTTILAMLAWLAALILAWLARTAAPAILTGLLLFLFGHALESSIFSLELVFLHRNYGPSLGVLLAVVGLAALIAGRLGDMTPVFRRTMPILAGFAALILVGAVLARASVWQSEARLIAQELREHPNTVRTRLVATTYALERGNPSAALHQIDAIASFGSAADQGTSSIFKLLIYYCEARVSPDEDVIDQFNSPPPYIHGYALRAFELLTRRLEDGTCGELRPQMIIPGARQWLRETRQPSGHVIVWRFRYDLARLTALTGDLREALQLALTAWKDSGHDFIPGMLAFRLSAAINDLATAERIYERLKEESNLPDLNKRIVLEGFRRYLESPESQNLHDLPSAQLGENALQ